MKIRLKFTFCVYHTYYIRINTSGGNLNLCRYVLYNKPKMAVFRFLKRN